MEDSGRKRSRRKSKSSRKHLDKGLPEPEIRGFEESIDGGVLDDANEPTIGEKLEILKLLEADIKDAGEKKESQTSLDVPPTANSVHVLLKQALRADDRAMLLECIYNQNDKVITNSVSQLSPADVIKLFNSFLSLIHSRGAVLVCALLWLKSLLLQHATGIMSQESSMMSLNSLYQIVDEDLDEEPQIIPVVYEDISEEESGDDMETDNEENGEGDDEPSEGSGSDLEVNDVMSD